MLDADIRAAFVKLYPDVHRTLSLWDSGSGKNPMLAYYLAGRIGAENFADMAARGDLPALRIVQSLPYWDGETTTQHPAMLGLVQNQNGIPVAVHRTYLSADGRNKAQVDAPKKITTPTAGHTVNGAAIRLWSSPGDVLAVAEGIETAIAVRVMLAASGNPAPVWATISAGGMETFQWPYGLKRLFIFADLDFKSARGELAARRLAERFGPGAEIIMPPAKLVKKVATLETRGVDWADIIKWSATNE